MLIRLILGDRSNDGHGLTESYNYESNLSALEIQDAHQAGVNLLAVQQGDWIKEALVDLCASYEDNTISPKLRTALQNYGIVLGYDACEGYMDTDSFASLYTQIAKLGRPDLMMRQLSMSDINIGGYGLFHGDGLF